MSLILVTLTSLRDSDFERSNMSLKEKRTDIVGLSSNITVLTTTFESTKEKLYGS